MSRAEELRERIRGPVFSILTPFRREDEKIDYACLERYVQQIYDSGGRIFYVMAYNSRYAQLTFDEILELNRFVVKTAKSIDSSNIVIVGDPIECSTQISKQFAQAAEHAGADLISLLVRERYYSDEQIATHYETVANSSDIHVLIHEMPFLCGLGGPTVDWPISLLDRLADHPRIIAIKEDAKNDAYSREVISKVRDRLSIVISGGGKRQWLRFADEGCQAWLNGIGVFEPRLATAFYRWWCEGEEKKWRQIIERIEVPFFEQGVQKYGWHLTIKAALEFQGIMPRVDRLPLMPLNDAQYREVSAMMGQLPIDEVLSQ